MANALDLDFPIPVAQGGTAVTSVTVSPTATAFAGWDANANLSADNFIAGYDTTATAAGTTVLTVASKQQQFFTGTTTQTVTLPAVSTLVLGQSFRIVNNSTGVVTVNSSGGNTIQAMVQNTQMVVTCILTSGTTAASWNNDYDPEGLGVTSITGTANQITASAATGDVTLSLPADVQIADSILDANGAAILTIDGQASAISNFIITNGVTGIDPIIGVTGTATDININLQAKGAGFAAVLGNGVNEGELRLYSTANNGSIGLHYDTASVSYEITFPTAQGANLSVMQNDGSGNLSWTASPAFTNVQINGNILDSNSNEIIKLAAVGSAVNEISIANNATGASPYIFSTGTDANIGMNLQTKGTGLFNFFSDGGTGDATLVLLNRTSSAVSLAAPTTLTTYGMVLPQTQGAAASTLQNDGSGNLSWVNNGGYTTTASAAGTTTITSAATYYQFFTGATTQTLVLPVASTLVLGRSFFVASPETATITVQSSGANTISTVSPGTHRVFICILTSGTSAASWYAAI